MEASGNEGTVGRAHQQWEGQGTGGCECGEKRGPLGLGSTLLGKSEP